MNFRPRFSLLENEDLERIISCAYDLLTTTGVKIMHQEALEFLVDHGASVVFSTHVAVIPQDLIEKCLKTVPSSLVFHNYQGDETLSTKDDSVNFVLDSAPVYLLDSRIRSANTKDIKTQKAQK